MTEPLTKNQIFILKLTEIIHANLKNENFGVKELASESGMNQKTLRKRLLSINNKSVNQFIREVRLEKALELLQNEEITASEVAYRVGFSSPAYFSTCFTKFYGYPPGKVKLNGLDNHDQNFQTINGAEPGKRNRTLAAYLLSVPGIIILAITLVPIVILLYKNLNLSDSKDNLISPDGRISIAVMPFQNMTNDTLWDIWQDVIQNEIITYLTNYEELKLKQSESVSGLLKSNGITSYATLSPSLAGLISKKLDANVFLLGKIMQAGTTLRVNAQLINTKTKEVYKTFQIEGTAKEDFIFKIIDSLSIQLKNYLLISVLEKELLPDERRITSTGSAEAYRNYVNGLKAFLRKDFSTAVDLYSRALALDSDFTVAASDMSYAYAYLGRPDQQRKWCLWLYNKRNMMPPLQKIFVEFSYANNFGTPYEALSCLKRLQEYDEKGLNFHFLMGHQYLLLGQINEAIIEFKKNLELLTETDPEAIIDWNYTGLGLAYHRAGLYNDERKLYKKAEKYFPESRELIYRQAILSFSEGDTIASVRYIAKYQYYLKSDGLSEADIMTRLAEMYSEAGLNRNAEDYYRKALSLEPDKIVRIRNLSDFLIDKELGIEEGIAFADSVLKTNPQDFDFLQIKGWGKYKQGDQKQALELLQKSWDLRNQYSVYDHTAYLHLEEVKKAGTNSR
jgi:AraC-like DNA-binding protein/tetratricopeptide (TPR) repeat protein